MPTPQKPDPLVGRCYVVFGDDGYWNWQGSVIARLNEDSYLVQQFECGFGAPATMKVVALADMRTPITEHRQLGSWEFFEDGQHLREWCAAHSRPIRTRS